ncbi:HEAT repeat domain-containing protein [Tautonia plasticadhaerens]|uniref:HEAT repeat protein n=1 Tax=Tautonia plasticadhaerens TaxID=2527974 RepID=A0A518HA90_9BACT|nr:HEAT repeat domain-containing protein [Tautonia plasticadhaerens]QDV37775.1 hypothetical protein ElP_57210 [Tautonia plasticadhaerens]
MLSNRSGHPFDRFLANPLKDDKLCREKIAIVEALDRMAHPDTGVYLQAATHVQLEPAWGETEDSAPPLRAADLVALARAEGVRSLPVLVDAMADPARDVRIAAAGALGGVGNEAAGLVLRLKVRLGDRDPEVFSEYLGGLLAVDAGENLPLVANYPDPANPVACEAAARALGKSRLPEAFDPLADCWRRAHSVELKRHLLLAVAILRRPTALDFLAGIVASEPDPDATAALSALGVYKDDPRLREGIAGIVEDRDRPVIRAAFGREFRY